MNKEKDSDARVTEVIIVVVVVEEGDKKVNGDDEENDEENDAEVLSCSATVKDFFPREVIRRTLSARLREPHKLKVQAMLSIHF